MKPNNQMFIHDFLLHSSPHLLHNSWSYHCEQSFLLYRNVRKQLISFTSCNSNQNNQSRQEQQPFCPCSFHMVSMLHRCLWNIIHSINYQCTNDHSNLVKCQRIFGLRQLQFLEKNGKSCHIFVIFCMLLHLKKKKIQ